MMSIGRAMQELYLADRLDRVLAESAAIASIPDAELLNKR
jgi:hypothetical protein